MNSKSILRDLVLGKKVLGLDGSLLPREIIRALEDARQALCFEERALVVLDIGPCSPGWARFAQEAGRPLA